MLVAIALVLYPASALAARAWTVVASPHTLVVDDEVAVTLKVTNDSSSGSGIECVQVTVPADFEVAGAQVISAKGQTGGSLLGWNAAWLGGSLVAFKTTLGNGALDEGDTAVFEVTGVPTKVGPMTWKAVASDDAGLPATPTCGAADFRTVALDFDVKGGPVATPTPEPTPTPSPTPTPRPTPRPTLPLPLPSIIVLPEATPSPSPAPTARPSPRGSARPDASSGAPSPVEPDPSPSSPPGRSPEPEPAGFVIAGDRGPDEPVVAFDGSVLDVLNGLPGGIVGWAYPVFVVSVPGLLLLLAIGAQALGAFAWLPLIRRRLGGSDRRP